VKRISGSSNECGQLAKMMGELDVVVHPCNPRAWEAKAEGSRIQGQLGLHSETLPISTEQKQK
jgi:hypothetical protein